MTHPTALERLDTLQELWRRERETTQRRFIEQQRERPLAERVERGYALRDLSVDSTDAAPGYRTLLWISTPDADAIDRLDAHSGTPVLLYLERPDEEDALRGVVSRKRGGRLGVIIEGDLPEDFEDPGFRLDLDAPTTTFLTGERAIKRFRDAKEAATRRLRAVLFADATPDVPDDPEPIEPRDRDLNLPQLEACALAHASRDIALVHGPPGTGKTRTLVEIIHQAAQRGESVLATAASNTAVDNLAERLVQAGLEVVRVGHPARVSPNTADRALDALLEQTSTWKLTRSWMAEANAIRDRVRKRYARGSLRRHERRQAMSEAWRLTKDARKQLRSEQDRILDGAQVICATASGSDARVLGSRRFDLVVLDEATQATDPIALVALSRASRAVFAGDPHQLPPTVIDPEAERDGLGRTLFERLASAPDGGRALRMLTVQHRMHEAIMQFPSESMYEGKLIASPRVAQHRLEELPGVAPDPLRPHPFIFIDTAGKGWDELRDADDPSTSNPEHAARIARELARLISRGVDPSEVAVVTPYRAQVKRIRDLVQDVIAEGLEVNTVDGFQGREKEAILLDLVRSNDRGEIGFLADTRRMNVALTRARRQLIVLGDSATFGHHPYYRAFLDAVEAVGCWISAWDDDAPALEA